MDYLTKEDLAQMDRVYLQNLDHDTLIDVACKLRDFGVDLIERLEQVHLLVELFECHRAVVGHSPS